MLFLQLLHVNDEFPQLEIFATELDFGHVAPILKHLKRRVDIQGVIHLLKAAGSLILPTARIGQAVLFRAPGVDQFWRRLYGRFVPASRPPARRRRQR